MNPVIPGSAAPRKAKRTFLALTLLQWLLFIPCGIALLIIIIKMPQDAPVLKILDYLP